MEKKEWVKIVEDNRSELEREILEQWELALLEHRDVDKHNYVIIDYEGNVITGRRWDNQKMAWELDGKALNIVEFRGLVDEQSVDEHYNGDAKAWAKDYADFYPLDVDAVINKALEGKK